MFARDYRQHGNNFRRHIFTVSDGSFDDDIIAEETAEVYNINEVTKNNKTFDKSFSTRNLLSNSCPNDMQVYFDNPVFESDFECENNLQNGSICLPASNISKPSIPKIVNFTTHRSNNPDDSSNVNPDAHYTANRTFKETDNRQTEIRDLGQRPRRYETWPSPKTRRKSLTRNLNQQRSFTPADHCCPDCRLNNQEHCDIRCGVGKSKSFQGTGHNCKDNRFKSSIRKHAMADPSSLTHSLDEHAVESLSKEDLLVLWKRSEIELQTKLNRIISQNNHLRQMISIVEAVDDDVQETTEGSNGSVRVTRL